MKRADRGVDIVVSHPREGQMRLVSRYFFADPKAEACQEFVEKILEIEEVRAIEIQAAAACAHIEYTNGVAPAREVIGKISRHLRNGGNGGRPAYVNLSLLAFSPIGMAVSVLATVLLCHAVRLADQARLAAFTVAVMLILWALHPSLTPVLNAALRLSEWCIGAAMALIAVLVWPEPRPPRAP